MCQPKIRRNLQSQIRRQIGTLSHGEELEMKEPFYHQENSTAYLCIQNNTSECGHYQGRQGL